MKRIEGQAFKLAEPFAEMAAAAWHPVCLYRLTLGRQDKLQDAVLEFQQQSGLEPSASPDAIRKFVENSSEAKSKLEFLRRYVPTRFLAPWFPELRGKQDSLRDRLIKEKAKESQRTPTPCPYYFEGSGAGESIKFNESWRAFLLENMAIVQAFAEYHLALYLQLRNPNVPGVVNKLRAPTARRLTLARRFWHLVRSDMEKTGMLSRFQDIYSEKPLPEAFAIDHFLPWSFVVHDLLWNLTPVEAATNSMKGDVLPDLDLYLPRLARLHFAAVQAAKSRPTFLEDYTDCFKQDPVTLLTLGEGGFIAKYREVIVPQAQIATNQGFQSGWKLVERVGWPRRRFPER